MDTWLLTKTFRFEAAHRLTEHDGKCARLHGHSWVMRVTVGGERIKPPKMREPKSGMLVDYADLKSAVSPIVEKYLDHYYLNETLNIYPTSEEIAKWAYHKIHFELSRLGLPCVLESVGIDETCTSSCRYSYQAEIAARGDESGLPKEDEKK